MSLDTNWQYSNIHNNGHKVLITISCGKADDMTHRYKKTITILKSTYVYFPSFLFRFGPLPVVARAAYPVVFRSSARRLTS